MKGIIKFDLNDPDDKREHTLMIKASDMHSTLWDLSQEIRNKLKYVELSDEEEKVWEEVSEIFYNTLNSHTINLDL